LREILFIVNPISAHGKALSKWAASRQELLKSGISFDEVLTGSPGEGAQIARAAIELGATCIVAVGGDGVLSELVNGYLDGSGRPINPEARIGLLPCGTSSDFARSLGLRGVSDLIRALLARNSRQVDAGRLESSGASGCPESRFFINMATFGLGGQVAAAVNRWRKRLPKLVGGQVRFSLAALLALKNYRNVLTRIVLDDCQEIVARSGLICVANGRFAGSGMKLAPEAELDDGLFDIVVADGATRLDIIKELFRVRSGGHVENPKVRLSRARELSINPEEPMAVEADGESVGQTPARLCALPRAVRILV
jgi:diacylglycerol kinase (ATP)